MVVYIALFNFWYIILYNNLFICNRDLSYDHFNTRLKMLFLEVVSILCFGSGSYSPPESELIEFLLGIVFNVDEKRTQDLTPFTGEQKDENPVIRSVLLQLMLSRE